MGRVSDITVHLKLAHGMGNTAAFLHDADAHAIHVYLHEDHPLDHEHEWAGRTTDPQVSWRV